MKANELCIKGTVNQNQIDCLYLKIELLQAEGRFKEAIAEMKRLELLKSHLSQRQSKEGAAYREAKFDAQMENLEKELVFRSTLKSEKDGLEKPKSCHLFGSKWIIIVVVDWLIFFR